MAIAFNLAARHQVVAANSHFYEKPTEPLYLNRTLQCHDLIYLCAGQWMVTEAEIDYQLEKDDVLLLSAGHHHYTRLPCAPNTQTICIHVSCEAGDLTDLPDAVSLPAFMRIGGRSRAKEYFQRIVSTFWSDQNHKQARLSTLFNQLVLELLDATESAHQQGADLSTQIIECVDRMPHRRFTTKEIASRYAVSTKTVDAAMVRRTGLTFSKYQNSRKLEMAASQIAVEPDVKLSEIAATLAFCDEFHLSHAFKKKYGLSPSEYKRKIEGK